MLYCFYAVSLIEENVGVDWPIGFHPKSQVSLKMAAARTSVSPQISRRRVNRFIWEYGYLLSL